MWMKGNFILMYSEEQLFLTFTDQLSFSEGLPYVNDSVVRSNDSGLCSGVSSDTPCDYEASCYDSPLFIPHRYKICLKIFL